ncbi:MAG: glycosyltransferase [Desulfarculus sp.]|nr:glycosyltransferase [Desulfarculus sp.]
MPPLVSVLLSVYNGQDYLAQALDSLLGQTLTDLEILAVDDGSTDHTWPLLQDYARRDQRLRLMQNPANLGLTRSLNRGLGEARGRYLARQDVDDLSEPQRLEAQVAFLEQNPKVVILGSDIRVVDQAGRPTGEIGFRPRSDAGIRRYMLLNNAFFHSTVTLRRQALVDHGLAYDETLAYAQDFDLWSRLLEHGQGANLPQPWLRFRRHGGQLSETAWQAQQAVADQVAMANLARQGLAGRLSQRDIYLLRRVALGPGALSGRERLEQLEALRRFGALPPPPGAGQDPGPRQMERELWSHLRRQVLRLPRGLDDLKAQAAILAADPAGAVAGLAARLKERLSGRRGPGVL